MTPDPTLIVRHAAAWAADKSRSLDTRLLQDVLDLRSRYDERGDVDWPAGSVERLLLDLWPAYATSLPDLGELSETLDAYWMFLRATGRLTRTSASPAELRKECRRAVPRMAEAYDDPARHSQGRVLGDFGRSIGIDLDGAADLDEMQERLQRITTAWNDLPVEERLRLMPDPSPKGEAARAWNLSAGLGPAGEHDGTEEMVRPGDLAVSARQARESPFVQACLALAEWVGPGRAVTSRGLLRPAVAREAYDELRLWEWDMARERVAYQRVDRSPEPDSQEYLDVRASNLRDYWTSAGDCLALDRLWFACVEAELVEVRSTKARRTPDLPATEEEWRGLGLVLMCALTLRVDPYEREPLTGVLLTALMRDGEVSLDELHAQWKTRQPSMLSEVFDEIWPGRLDLVLHQYDDTGIWHRTDRALSLTEFGRDFVLAYVNMLEEGWFGDDD